MPATHKSSWYKNAVPLPFHGGERCYACDSRPQGLRDRRPEGGDVEVACSRHADPRVRFVSACIYCNGAVRKGSLVIDGDFAHARCHREQCGD